MKEVESRPIKIDASKLARVESERLPTKIFQYSNGAIEESGKSDYGLRNILHKTSSTSSVDSGFSVTPSSPNFPLPLTCLPPAPYISLDSLLERSFTRRNSDPGANDDGSNLGKLGASPPPPLPVSFPPTFLERSLTPDILSDEEYELQKLKSVEPKEVQIHLLPVENTKDESEALQFYRNVTSDSNESTYDESSDCDDLNDVTAEDNDTSSYFGVPVQISKLEGSVKTIRSKIKPGTVHKMRKLFKKKNKRPKPNDTEQNHSIPMCNDNFSQQDLNTRVPKEADISVSSSTSDSDQIAAMTNNGGTSSTINDILERTNFEQHGENDTDKDSQITLNSTHIKSDCANNRNVDLPEDDNTASDKISESNAIEYPVKRISNDFSSDESFGNVYIGANISEAALEPLVKQSGSLLSESCSVQPEHNDEQSCTDSTYHSVASHDGHSIDNSQKECDNEISEEDRLKEKAMQELILLQCFSTADEEIKENKDSNEDGHYPLERSQQTDTHDTIDNIEDKTAATPKRDVVQEPEHSPYHLKESLENCFSQNPELAVFDREYERSNGHPLYPEVIILRQNREYVNAENIEILHSSRVPHEDSSGINDAKRDAIHKNTSSGSNAKPTTNTHGTSANTPVTKGDDNKTKIKVESGVNNAFQGGVKIKSYEQSETATTSSPAAVYWDDGRHTTDVQVTMTSGDKRGTQETVTPVLINDLQVSRDLDTATNYNSTKHPSGIVDIDEINEDKNQRAETYLNGQDDGDSSESSNIVDKRSIEASYGHSSDESAVNDCSNSHKSVNLIHGDKLNRVNGNINTTVSNLNSGGIFGSDLPKFSDISQNDAYTENEQSVLDSSTSSSGDASLHSNDITEKLKGVANVAILFSGVLNNDVVDQTGENNDSKQRAALKPEVNDGEFHMRGDKYRPRSSKCSDERWKANDRGTTGKTLPSVTSNDITTDDLSAHACLSSGKREGVAAFHVTSNLTATEFTNSVQTSPPTQRSTRSEAAHVKQNRDLPEFYSLPESFEASKIVTLKEIPARRRRMPERGSGYTSSESESSGYTGGRKVSTRTETMRSRKHDGKVVELKEGELESNIHVQHLAETISKLTGDNTEELLPEINQTVTQLPGGNLVITTLTHKVVEEEEEEKEKTQVPDDKSRYIVQDHTGQYYYVEDITDETQESAYFSSSDRNTSGSSLPNGYDGYGQTSGEFQGIHNLQALGRSNIGYDTAEEVLLGLYNQPGTMEIQELDEREYEERCWQKQPANQVLPYEVANNSSFNKQTTQYAYDDDKVKRPVPHNIGSSTVKTVKHSYEMESSAPWVTDGTTSKQADDGEIVTSDHDDGFSQTKRESMQTTETHADQAGISSMCAAYMLQSSASVVPPVIQPPVIQQFVPPPPLICPPPVQPEYRIAKIDFTPSQVVTSTPQICESETQTTEVVEEREIKQEKERPIFKTIALVKGPYESPKWQRSKEKEDEQKVYKVVDSRASEDLKEETVEYTENTKTVSTYKMENTGCDENSNFVLPTYVNQPTQRYRTEKVFQVNGTSPSPSPSKSFQTKINVSGNHFDQENSNYEYIQQNRRERTEMKSSQDGFRIDDDLDRPRDIRVVRGNILIKNTMDEDLDDYNDNINLFDRAFNMSKDNPLYQSDEDLYKRYEREKELERLRQQRMEDRLNQDITFETVDRFTKSKDGE